MDIKVSGRKTTVTDALRAHVDEKIGEALKVFDIEPMTVDVVLRYEKNPSNPNPAIVEVTVRARGSVIRVAEHGADMYAAIDLSADKVTRQLRKFKTKVVDNRQGGASAADVAPVERVEDLADLLLPEEEDDLLVREKVIDVTPMTEEQALVQTATTSTCSRTRRLASSMWCITVRMVDMASSSPASKHLTSKIR
jgi:putative sigma-54 modulation protein